VRICGGILKRNSAMAHRADGGAMHDIVRSVTLSALDHLTSGGPRRTDRARLVNELAMPCPAATPYPSERNPLDPAGSGSGKSRSPAAC